MGERKGFGVRRSGKKEEGEGGCDIMADRLRLAKVGGREREGVRE
jgi:hypothetical protein